MAQIKFNKETKCYSVENKNFSKVVYEAPKLKEMIDNLAVDVDEFLAKTSLVAGSYNLLSLNSGYPRLLQNNYLRSKIDYSKFLRSVDNGSYKELKHISDFELQKIMKVILYLSDIDSTMMGNSSKEGIYSVLKVLYDDGKIFHSSYNGFADSIKRINIDKRIGKIIYGY